MSAEHGQLSRYTHGRCRCDVCRAAWSAYMREYKKGYRRSTAPSTCLYCDGRGNSTAGGECGFCEAGVPLDTQEDWDRSWGRIFTSPPPGEVS